MTDAAADRPRPPGGRLLFVLPWSLQAIGGVNEVVRNLIACAMEGGRWKPGLLVADYAARQPVRLEEDGIPTIRMRLAAPWLPGQGLRYFAASLLAWPRSLLGVVQLLTRSPVDCINIHYPGPSSLTLLLAVRLLRKRPRVVLSFHGADIAHFMVRSELHRRLLRWLVRLADASVCCSHHLLVQLRDTVGNTRFHGVVVHNGIDIKRTTAQLQEGSLPAALAGAEYVANVGTFEEKKGQDLLLRAFAGIRRELPQVKLVLAGRDGPWLDTIRRLIDTLGLAEHVVLLIDLPHPQALRTIAGASLFALSSRKEPFGIVLLEAAVLDVPVVAMNVGGVPEIVVDGQTGILVPAEDVQSLGREIVRLQADRALAARLADGAANRVHRTFTWALAFRSYELQYDGEG